MQTLIECKKKNMDMKEMDNMVVEETTKEYFEVLELVEDIDRSFVIIAAKQVILREIVKTLLRHVTNVNLLTV